MTPTSHVGPLIEAGERLVEALLAPHVLVAIANAGDQAGMAQFVAAVGAVRVARAAYDAGLITAEHEALMASMQQQLHALTSAWDRAAEALKGVPA